MKISATISPCMASSGRFLRIFLLTLVTLLLFSACDDQRLQTITWIEFEPVYMSHEEFENAVQMEAPRELTNPGKIYFYNGYLFVNEINKGVHIIDNRNPASPSIVGFINIPANKDLAVKDDLLYADSYSDLLVFDITNLQDAELIARKEGIFEFSVSKHPGYPYQPVEPSKGIVVDWKKVEVEEVCEGDCYGYGPDVVFDFNNASAEGAGAPQTGGASSGVGGSMARLAINGNYLYAVDDQSLVTFNIASPEPKMQSKEDLGWAIETIFPYESNLFVGSESAMYIYDIANPAFPKQLSVYTHITACDPVVVEGDYAYVTLRSGGRCQRGVNRLEVIDVKDKSHPEKVAFYEMLDPHGLGIDDGNLFISEGDKGLKILDARDPFNIKQLRHIGDIETFDVIPYNDVLMVTGGSGILQYDYSDINNLKHLSTIPVNREEW